MKNTLAIKRLLFEISSHQPLPLKGDFPTVTLRGAFGYSLVQIVARSEARNDDEKVEICKRLFFSDGISDNSAHENVARPFVIRGGYTRSDYKAFIMEMLLFGDAIEYEELIDEVVLNMCKMGLGKQGRPCDCEKLHSESIIPEVPDLSLGSCEVDFISPARIKVQGRYLNDMIPFHVLVARFAARFNELRKVYGDGTDEDFSELKKLSEYVTSDEVDGEVVRARRKSTRTGDVCELTGYVGTMFYQGELRPFEELLAYLPWLNVGSSTAFGCGWCAVVGNKNT